MLQASATHYDNLKVTRDAPVGVIKASYRTLSQKYHPDRNPDPAALEIMKLVNLAWDGLSNPERRARHDRAIAALDRQGSVNTATSRACVPPSRTAPQANHAARVAVGLALLVALMIVAVLQMPRTGSDDSEQPAPDDIPQLAAERERLRHGYLVASVQDNSPGVALVDIDNTAGLADVEVRLFLHDRAARSMYVHQGRRFVVENLAPGKYAVKYRLETAGKIRAFQEPRAFQPQRDKFIKLKLKVPGAPGADATAVEIRADQF